MSNNSTRIKQVFFIDSAVPDSDVMVANLATDAIYYRLDASQDGLQQMADSLAGYSGLDAIHVISHGAPGSLQLGNGVVTQATLDDHSAALSSIGNALTETGDLLLYGCDVAQGEEGQAFIRQLATATGADVAASVDLTGAQAQGGDWVLEATTGAIEADKLITQQNYNHVLNYSDDYDLALMSDMVGGVSWTRQLWIVFSPSRFKKAMLSLLPTEVQMELVMAVLIWQSQIHLRTGMPNSMRRSNLPKRYGLTIPMPISP